MSRRIVIVGNGDIPDGVAGTIDAADMVIRFNGCRSAGRGGRKTDVVAVCNTGRPAMEMLAGGRWKASETVRQAREIWCVRASEVFAALRAPLAESHPDLDDFCDDHTDGFRTFAVSAIRSATTRLGSTHMRFGMKLGAAALALAAGLGLSAAAAQAGEVWIGGYAHGVGTKQAEGGFDTQIGVRSGRIDGLWFIGKPSVHALFSVNSEVRTDFGAVGFNWPLAFGAGKRWYIRPGIGLAYTNGEADIGNAYEPGITAAERDRRIRLTATRIDFGSNVLFEPELALGYRFNDRVAVEASYVHLSNGQILHQGKNQGLDDVGVRLNYRFGGGR